MKLHAYQSDEPFIEFIQADSVVSKVVFIVVSRFFTFRRETYLDILHFCPLRGMLKERENGLFTYPFPYQNVVAVVFCVLRLTSSREINDNSLTSATPSIDSSHYPYVFSKCCF